MRRLMQSHEPSGTTTSQERSRYARPDSRCRSCIPFFFPRSCLHSEGDAELLDTSLAASGEVLRITLDDTDKGGETARTGSVLLVASSRCKVPKLSPDALPNTIQTTIASSSSCGDSIVRRNRELSLNLPDAHNYIKISVTHAIASLGGGSPISAGTAAPTTRGRNPLGITPGLRNSTQRKQMSCRLN